MSKFKWMMTVLLALSMIAAACGDDDTDEAASDSASTVEEENEDYEGKEAWRNSRSFEGEHMYEEEG